MFGLFQSKEEKKILATIDTIVPVLFTSILDSTVYIMDQVFKTKKTDMFPTIFNEVLFLYIHLIDRMISVTIYRVDGKNRVFFTQNLLEETIKRNFNLLRSAGNISKSDSDKVTKAMIENFYERNKIYRNFIHIEPQSEDITTDSVLSILNIFLFNEFKINEPSMKRVMRKKINKNIIESLASLNILNRIN